MSRRIVALTPQCDSVVREIIAVRLPPRIFVRILRPLDANPARETLMKSIMLNAIVPAGCVSDLGLFRH
jgi:hypothetical protein